MNKVRFFSPFERPLAITETKLHDIAAAYLRHEAGEKIDFSGLTALVQQKSSRETGGHGYTVQDGVAIIDVEGILGKGMNLFMWISGGTSTELLQKDLADAADDDTVHSIITRIDSPGGDVDGTQLLADAVAATGKKKPVVAWVTGLGASAAYWIASQTSQIILADETTWVGSIGVVAGHVDRSKMDEQRGVKRTEITAGKYKRIASDTAPLSQEGRQTIQDQVDSIYAVFLQNVASGRGMTPDQVHEDMADGRLFMGQQAIDVGLADSIATLDQVIAQLNADYQTKLQNPGAKAPTTHSTGESTMFTQEDLDKARAEGVALGKTEGATAELNRIKGIAGLQMPGHAALIKTMMFDGATTPEQAAVKVVAAQQEALVKAGQDLENDAPAPAPAAVIDPSKPNEPKPVESGANGSGSKPEAVDPAAHATAIRNHIATAKAAGRTISAAEADAELTAAAKK